VAARSSPSTPEGGIKPGSRLFGTKYELVRKLGEGGMGVVYQVVKPPRIQGVLKRMNADLASHEEFVKMFFDEVSVLAQLDHPNIVRVYDFDRGADGVPFYVMELLVGQNLRDVLDAKGVLPPTVAYEIARQLLAALHCAHTHEVAVVHRDVKPENIFLHTPKHGPPVVKLIDFGVVAFLDDKGEGTFSGTIRYAAPEQIQGKRPTAQSDIYAAALVLYEMLAGASPFEHRAHDDKAMMSAHLAEAPPDLFEVAPWVPKEVAALVMQALEKDANKRPRDAMRFSERLAELGVVKPAGQDRAPWEDRQAEVLRNRSRPKTQALAAIEAKPKLVDLWREVAMGLGFGALAVAALHFVLSH
jgi:serine/threonine-protein kinase